MPQAAQKAADVFQGYMLLVVLAVSFDGKSSPTEGAYLKAAAVLISYGVVGDVLLY